jgi:hypothetical protein
MIANFIPEYSTRNPATSSDSAFEDVEGGAVLRRDAGDDEREERELADHRIGDEPQPRLRRPAMSDMRSDPASITGTSAANRNGKS